MVDVDDEKRLKLLSWAVYDGVLLPRDPPQLQGQHGWVWINVGTYHLVFRGRSNFDQCPRCTTASFDAKQATRKATQQCGHTQPSAAAPSPRACRSSAL